eukprot:gene3859-4122_t
MGSAHFSVMNQRTYLTSHVKKDAAVNLWILIAIFQRLDLTRVLLSYLDFYWIYQIFLLFLEIAPNDVKKNNDLRQLLAQMKGGSTTPTSWHSSFQNFLQSIETIHTGYYNPALESLSREKELNLQTLEAFIEFIRPQLRQCFLFIPKDHINKRFPFESSSDLMKLGGFLTNKLSLPQENEGKKDDNNHKPITHNLPKFTHLAIGIERTETAMLLDFSILYEQIDEYLMIGLPLMQFEYLQYLCLDYGSDSPVHNLETYSYYKSPSLFNPNFSIIDSLNKYCPHLKRADIIPQLTVNDYYVFLSPDFVWNSLEEFEPISFFYRFIFIEDVLTNNNDGIEIKPMKRFLPSFMYDEYFGKDQVNLDIFAAMNTNKFPSLKRLDFISDGQENLLFFLKSCYFVYWHYQSSHSYTFIGHKIEKLRIELLQRSDKFSLAFQKTFPAFFNKQSHEFDEFEEFLHDHDSVEEWMNLFQFSKEYPILSTPHLDKLCLFPNLRTVHFSEDIPLRYFMFLINQSSSSYGLLDELDGKEHEEQVLRSNSAPFEVYIGDASCEHFLEFLENLYPSGRWNITKLHVNYEHYYILPGIEQYVSTQREYAQSEEMQAIAKRPFKTSHNRNHYTGNETNLPLVLEGLTHVWNTYVEFPLLYQDDLVGIPRQNPTNHRYFADNPTEYRPISDQLFNLQHSFQSFSRFLLQENTLQSLEELSIPFLWLVQYFESLVDSNFEALTKLIYKRANRQKGEYKSLKLELIFSRFEITLIEEFRLLEQLLTQLAYHRENDWSNIQVVLRCLTYSKWDQLRLYYLEELKSLRKGLSISSDFKISIVFFKEKTTV